MCLVHLVHHYIRKATKEVMYIRAAEENFSTARNRIVIVTSPFIRTSSDATVRFFNFLWGNWKLFQCLDDLPWNIFPYIMKCIFPFLSTDHRYSTSFRIYSWIHARSLAEDRSVTLELFLT